MRLGLNHVLAHRTPEEWAEKTHALGFRASVLPCGAEDDVEAYVSAAASYDIRIAEVGAWSNPLSPDPDIRARDLAFCKKQLALADRAGAGCCVNISGARGPVWDAGYAENYTEETRALLIDTVREILDAVNPQNTFYTLEPMPFMRPWSPEDYAQLIRDVDHPRFAVHLDALNMVSSAETYFDTPGLLRRCFALLGKHIRSCHLKDVTLDHGGICLLKEVPCFKGGFDLVTYMRLAHENDPETPMLIEHLQTEEEYLASAADVKAVLEREGIPY